MQDTNYRKRKRGELVNKLTEGLKSPPKICNKIETITGSFTFQVPSTSKPDIFYIVKIVPHNSNGLELSCSCRDPYNKLVQKIYCQHICAAIINLFNKSVNSMCELSLNNCIIDQLNDVTQKLEEHLSVTKEL
jgi:hypothetical protein